MDRPVFNYRAFVVVAGRFAACSTIAALTPLAVAETTFRPLFNGSDLAGWDSWLGARQVPALPFKLWGEWSEVAGLNQDSAGVFSVVVEDSEPAIRISGEQWGGLISKEAFGNYHLRLEYKWGEDKHPPRADKPRNTGLLYHSTGPYGAFWSYWMRSAEFEIMVGSTGDFSSVDGVRGEIDTVWDWSAPIPWQRYAKPGSPTSVGGFVFRVSGSADQEKTVGQWNTLELYTFENRAIHVVNGHQVLQITRLNHETSGASAALERGRIQLQSEGAEVFFRNIEIRSIAALPTD